MFKKMLLFSLVLCLHLLYSQTVSTVVAGNFHDGLAGESQGNIYGSDFFGDSVYKYDTNGNVTVFATGFSNPNGIGINANDEIYICDHTGNTIRKYDANGNLMANYNSGVFSTPSGIAPVPNSNDMVVVEYSNSQGRKIKRLAQDGTVTTLYSGSPLNGPAGIAYVGDDLYVANFNDRKIFRYSAGALIEIAQLPSVADPNVNFLGFMTSANGLLYATHMGTNSIYTIDPNTGAISVFAGSVLGENDGPISTATFNRPNGIYADENSNTLYISDSGTKNLRIITNALLSNPEFIQTNLGMSIEQNPIQDSFNITLSLQHKTHCKISIFDLNGKLVFEDNILPKTNVFSLKIPSDYWQSGSYFVKIKQDNLSVSEKVIK